MAPITIPAIAPVDGFDLLPTGLSAVCADGVLVVLVLEMEVFTVDGFVADVGEVAVEPVLELDADGVVELELELDLDPGPAAPIVKYGE